MSRRDVKMCSVGAKTVDECDKLSHTSSVGRKKLAEFSDDDKKVIAKRTNIPVAEITDSLDYDICLHHEQVFLIKFARNQKSCCNPYQVHISIYYLKISDFYIFFLTGMFPSLFIVFFTY